MEFYLLLEQLVELGLQDIDRFQNHLGKLSDLADKWSKKFGSLVRKKQTKPTGKSPKTMKRNQEIIDKAYQMEKKEIKPGVIYKRLAKGYDLSWETIKKIISEDDATPTILKKS